MIAAFGDGAIEIRNVLQMVYCCYALQACLSAQERHLIWNFLTDNPPPLKMNEPVLSRWWYVNVACTHLYEHWDQWKQFAEGLLASATAARYMGILASLSCR